VHRHNIHHLLTSEGASVRSPSKQRRATEQRASSSHRRDSLSRADKCSQRGRMEMWCRRPKTSGSRAKVFATEGLRARPDPATAAAEKVDVVFVTGRGGAGFHSPDPALARGRGGMFWVIPALPPSGAHPQSFPGRGPVCYHLFLTGTRLGYGWGGGLSRDRGRECRKRPPTPGR